MPSKSPEQIGAERILNLPTFESAESVPEAATNWVEEGTVEWLPICNDPNNRGHIEIVETDVQGLVELLTNSSDAYLIQHLDDVDSRSELLNAIEDDDEVLVEFTGDSHGGSDSEYSVVVADEGCGVGRNEFENAFLKDPSMGGVDKRKYKYLYGEFGQGSLASIGVSKRGCKFVASASKENPEKWSWSVTRYNEDLKRYEYLTVNGEIPTFDGTLRVGSFGRVKFGTVTKVFDIDSKQTPRDVTQNPFIRRLGHSFPETAVPLDIIDNRDGKDGRRRVWEGMKPEIDECDSVNNIDTVVNLDGFGKLRLNAYIVGEDDSFDNEFLKSQTRDRMFYTVYGMTHHTESYRTLGSQCELNGINEDVLLFIDCSELDTPINDIFLPSRTGMKEGKESEAFLNSVYDAIRDWDELQEIDKNRCSVADIVGTDGESPINGMNFDSFDSPVPSIESVNGEVNISLTVESTEVDYCEWDHVEFEVVGLTGDYDISVEGNKIDLSIEPVKDSTVTVCVEDTELDESFTRTFKVGVESYTQPTIEKDVQTLSESQSGRASRGNTFESEVVDKMSEKTDYTVSVESNTPTDVLEDLWFEVNGTQIKPDTDVVIHDGSNAKGIVSCKRSLRERVGQTAFWKLFLVEESVDIPIYLATPDPDDELEEGRKWRAVAEEVLDGVFVFEDDKEYFGDSVSSIETVSKINAVAGQN